MGRDTSTTNPCDSADFLHLILQVSQTANSDPHGPIPIWIWPQGPFTCDLWQEIVFAAGDTAEDYLQVLRDYSLAFARSQS